jgi:hypothetical protein
MVNQVVFGAVPNTIAHTLSMGFSHGAQKGEGVRNLKTHAEKSFEEDIG